MVEKSELSEKAAHKRMVCVSGLIKLTDLLFSPKTTIPWFLSSIGAPSWLLGLLVPIKEAGSLLPQWVVSKVVLTRFTSRSQVWQVGVWGQIIGVIGLAFMAALVDSSLLSLFVLLCLIAAAIGRSLCSITFKDIQAEYVAKERRGRLMGTATSASASVTIFIVLLWYLLTSSNINLAPTVLFMVGAIALIIASIVILPIRLRVTSPAEQQKDKNLIELLSDPSIKHMLINRVLLLHTALVTPFLSIQIFAQDNSSIMLLLAISAVASLLSAYIWGTISDTNALWCLRIASGLCAVALFFAWFAKDSSIVMSIMFFIVMVSHEGVRISRKTYLLNITHVDNRAQVVSLGNSIVGIVLLILGSTYAFSYQYLTANIIWIMGLVICVALLHTCKMTSEKKMSNG